MQNLECSDIIKKLGGGKKLTARLKKLTSELINEKTVYSWVRQGIPDRWKVAVARCLLEDNHNIRDYNKLLLPGISSENLTSANNSIQIFSESKVLKTNDENIDFSVDKETCIKIYKLMMRIRRFEEKAGQLYGMGKIGGFCHLYIGQEAVVVGINSALKDNDTMVTSYRDHGHMLVCGMDPKGVMAELTGRITGYSKGKGGSMHMFSREKGFFGGHGIVGAQVPIGAGLAFSHKYKNEKSICVTFFGDGAANQGQVYETFNIAALWSLPVLFIIENNLYGMGTSVERSSSTDNFATRGEAFGIENKTVNGMDVLDVREAAIEAVNYCRSNQKPFILEVKTYRFRGHSMSDPGKYRTRDEVAEMRKNGPLKALQKLILESGFNENELKEIDNKIKLKVNEAADFAIESELPDEAELFKDIIIE